MKPYIITYEDTLDMQHMRNIRSTIFRIINRGQLWYENLSNEQLEELRIWYYAWLDYPETKIIPPTPQWLEEEVEYEVAINVAP